MFKNCKNIYTSNKHTEGNNSSQNLKLKTNFQNINDCKNQTSTLISKKLSSNIDNKNKFRTTENDFLMIETCSGLRHSIKKVASSGKSNITTTTLLMANFVNNNNSKNNNSNDSSLFI